jgi:HSP90 family molecular chaperone
MGKQPPTGIAATIESLTGVGYTLKTAIADLIDNSITAQAKNIWIDFYWAGKDSYISILDDGEGMSEPELFEAMRPGGKNPNDERHGSDLGRFSLGLKTAYWSQARKVSVYSKSSKSNESK